MSFATSVTCQPVSVIFALFLATKSCKSPVGVPKKSYRTPSAEGFKLSQAASLSSPPGAQSSSSHLWRFNVAHPDEGGARVLHLGLAPSEVDSRQLLGMVLPLGAARDLAASRCCGLEPTPSARFSVLGIYPSGFLAWAVHQADADSATIFLCEWTVDRLSYRRVFRILTGGLGGAVHAAALRVRLHWDDVQDGLVVLYLALIFRIIHTAIQVL